MLSLNYWNAGEADAEVVQAVDGVILEKACFNGIITEAEIPEGRTAIGQFAFAYCDYPFWFERMVLLWP